MKTRIEQWGNLKTKEVAYGIQVQEKPKTPWRRVRLVIDGVGVPAIYRLEADALVNAKRIREGDEPNCKGLYTPCA